MSDRMSDQAKAAAIGAAVAVFVWTLLAPAARAVTGGPGGRLARAIRNPSSERRAWCVLRGGRTVDWYATEAIARRAAATLRSRGERDVAVRDGRPRPGIVVHSSPTVHQTSGGHRPA